ncbi:MAG: hypothetical protein HC906_08005 [Bacteroidales bacterium]|nr:hypothetical protein [Bacteroidales bacterium]
MFKKWFINFTVAGIVVLSSCSKSVKDYQSKDILPDIFPDYTSLTIPSNIAPLNFNINEAGTDFAVEIYSDNGNRIKLRQSSPKISIPIEKWHKLLDANKGNTLKTDVYVKNKEWTKYKTIIDTIANETIDNNLVYRSIGMV